MPLPGASNINFGAARNRGSFNVNTTPGGQLVQYNSPANPNFKPFAEPPPTPNLAKPPLQLQKAPTPLPDLAKLPKYTPVKPPASSPGNGALGVGAKTGVAVGAGGVAGGLTASNLGLLAILIWSSNLVQLYKLWKLSQPEPLAKVPDMRGGQDESKYYLISGQYTEIVSDSEDFSNSQEITWKFDKTPAFGARGYGGGELKGKVELLSKVDGKMYGGHTNGALAFKTGEFPEVQVYTDTKEPVNAQPNKPFGKLTSIDVVAVPADGSREPSPQLQQRRPAPQPQLQKQPQLRDPLPQFLAPPPPKPKLDIIPNLRKLPEKQPIILRLPGDQPITITSPDHPPIVFRQPQPQPQPQPSPTPQPQPQPQPQRDPFPTEMRFRRNTPPDQPQPIDFTPPQGEPITLTSPGSGAVLINIPGFQPITVDPRNSSRPGGATRSPFEPRVFTPTPLPSTPTRPGTSPSPTPRPQPSPNPQPTPRPNPNPNPQPTPEPSDVLIPATILATLTPMLQQLLRNTSPATMQPLVANAVCQTTQPGGCSASLANDTANRINQNTNNALERILNNTSNLANLGLLPIINNKLGAQVPGGLSGFLGRLSKSLGIDRALNLIGIAANLHNAMMLSANLKVTLLEMLSSVGNATGLLQTSENENVDLNAVFNKGIETFLISILGVESYAGLKVGLRKYNAIYQSAANSLNAVSSMFNSLGNVVEQGAEYTGKVGNALKGAGMVAENAYQWMSEKFDAKSSKFIKFQSTVGDVTQVLETINEIAESVVEGQQAATEFQKANTDFIKAVEDAKKNPGIENKAVKEEAAKAKENATKDPTGELEEGLLSFLTD